MKQSELQAKIVELKAAQSAYFSKKKAERNPDALATIRTELNKLKADAKAMVRKAK